MYICMYVYSSLSHTHTLSEGVIKTLFYLCLSHIYLMEEIVCDIRQFVAVFPNPAIYVHT